MRDIGTIIAALQAKHSQLRVEQLKVKFPGVDDDGIWFFTDPSSSFEVQLESSHGTFPFIVETDRHREVGQATNLPDAVHLVESWLGLAQ